MAQQAKFFVTGAILLSLGVSGILWLIAATNTSSESDLAHSTVIVETIAPPEASATPQPGENVFFVDAVEMREAMDLATLKYAYLPFPSDADQADHEDRLNRIPFEGNAQWEDGIQDMIVLNSWRCVWLDYAAASFETNSPEEAKRGGLLIEQLRGFPAIQQSFSDYEQYLQRWIQPIIDGDKTSAQKAIEADCKDW